MFLFKPRSAHRLTGYKYKIKESVFICMRFALLLLGIAKSQVMGLQVTILFKFKVNHIVVVNAMCDIALPNSTHSMLNGGKNRERLLKKKNQSVEKLLLWGCVKQFSNPLFLCQDQ